MAEAGGPEGQARAGDARRRRSATVIAVLVCGCTFGAYVRAVDGLIKRMPWDWGGFVASSAIGAVVMTVVAAMEKVAFPGRGREDPEGSLSRRQLLWTAVVFAAVSVLVAATAVVHNDNEVGVWALAVGLAAFAVVSLVCWRRFTRRVEDPAAG